MTDSDAGLEPDATVAVPITGPEIEAANGHDAPVSDNASTEPSSPVPEVTAVVDERAPGAVDEEEVAAEPFEPPDPYLPVRYVEVVMELPSTNPILVLEESVEPRRQLRIPIGLPEGVAIGYADLALMTPRPLTHRLFAEVLDWMGGTLEAVRITDVQNNSFSAEIVCSGPNGTQSFECRTSDAVALALRQYLPVPITAAPHVLDNAGVAVRDEST